GTGYSCAALAGRQCGVCCSAGAAVDGRAKHNPAGDLGQSSLDVAACSHCLAFDLVCLAQLALSGGFAGCGLAGVAPWFYRLSPSLVAARQITEGLTQRATLAQALGPCLAYPVECGWSFAPSLPAAGNGEGNTRSKSSSRGHF